MLLVDEAYIHFANTGSALEHVRKGRNVIVARTFSKIWGMAGLRVGFGCARPDLIEKLAPFRSGIISMVSQRAATAALRDAQSVLPARRERFVAARADLCTWLKGRGLSYIEPQANFVMFDVGRDAGEFGARMMQRKVMVGRPFPPLRTMLRVTLGTDAEMAQFKRAFEDAWKS
jgi:histidinol-phosphate/aromatic aminotransferase/cobyric acid decarboxylase-like protein